MEELNNDTVGFGVKSYDNPMPLNRSYCNGICHKFKSPMPRAGKNPY